jgi:hypothetical protein
MTGLQYHVKTCTVCAGQARKGENLRIIQDWIAAGMELEMDHQYRLAVGGSTLNKQQLDYLKAQLGKFQKTPLIGVYNERKV